MSTTKTIRPVTWNRWNEVRAREIIASIGMDYQLLKQTLFASHLARMCKDNASQQLHSEIHTYGGMDVVEVTLVLGINGATVIVTIAHS
ncbi:MAG TPA: hypothetical protein VGK19_21900 [Capsulimonadaceae bacterium]